MKKAELHCHIDGILDPGLAAEMMAEGVALGINLQAFKDCYGPYGFEAWQRYCNYLQPLVPKELFFPILARHVRRLRAQDVDYCEIMVSGLLFARPDVDGMLELFRRGRQRVDQACEGEIQVEFLVAIARGKLEKIESQVDRAIILFKAGLIKGLALAGDDRGFSLPPLYAPLARAKSAGLGIEIHAGELAGPQDIRDALDSGLTDRLGHAVSAFQDEGLVQRIIDKDLHIEFCPSSNLALGAVKSIEEHPLRLALDKGMNFSISTDDPGAFGCSLDSEFEMLRKQLGFKDEDFSKIYANSMRSAFRDRRP